jgi:aminopeptidase YwaD
MLTQQLAGKASTYLRKLCGEIDNRRVGSPGNQAAAAFLAETAAGFGFTVTQPQFKCIDWQENGAQLTVAGQPFAAQPSPYSRGGQFYAPLVVAGTLAELAAIDAIDKILLLRGELTREQLLPKNFPFYNPDEHRQIIALLEEKQPVAIITATAHNPEIAGGLSPFPLIEDGDFDIPSVFMTEEEGERLARYAGQGAALDSKARRIPSTGGNVIARKGHASRRVVVCAHFDAKINTPGAIDNAAGVVVVLLLAELLRDYTGNLGLELLLFNGEDYYAASGEIDYLAQHAGRLGEILLAINLDAVGHVGHQTAYSLYDCPAGMAGVVRAAVAGQQAAIEGQPWYQSDHSVFIQNGVPAVAITSESVMELSATITHTPKDTPEIVDSLKLAETALAVHNLLLGLNEHLAQLDLAPTVAAG